MSPGVIQWRVPAVFAALLLLPSCGLLEQARRVGVSAGRGSEIVVHYVLCQGEVVTRVTLFSLHTVVWDITSRPGSRDGVFRAGSPPSGFVERIPFREVEASESLTARVEARRGGITVTSSLGFDPVRLPTRSILTSGGVKDPTIFERDALATCRS
jgi:hypothetical protein